MRRLHYEQLNYTPNTEFAYKDGGRHLKRATRVDRIKSVAKRTTCPGVGGFRWFGALCKI